MKRRIALEIVLFEPRRQISQIEGRRGVAHTAFRKSSVAVLLCDNCPKWWLTSVYRKSHSQDTENKRQRFSRSDLAGNVL